MANSPDGRGYTKQHEWVRLDGDEATAGITAFAQEQLGDIVYFDLPEPGARVKQHAKMGEVESVKTVSDIYAPLSGEVVEINRKTVDTPEVVNEDPYGEGWLMKLKPSDPSEMDSLLSAEGYDALIAEAEGGQH